MAQFTVYQNKNPESQDLFPYLLDVQNDLLDNLNTRVVIPLCPTTSFKGKSISNLTPIFTIKRKRYTLLTHQMAGISRGELGPVISNLSEFRAEIIASLDFLFTGF